MERSEEQEACVVSICFHCKKRNWYNGLILYHRIRCAMPPLRNALRAPPRAGGPRPAGAVQVVHPGCLWHRAGEREPSLMGSGRHGSSRGVGTGSKWIIGTPPPEFRLQKVLVFFFGSIRISAEKVGNWVTMWHSAVETRDEEGWRFFCPVSLSRSGEAGP